MPLPASPLPIPLAPLSLGDPHQQSGLKKEFHSNRIKLSCRKECAGPWEAAGSEFKFVGVLGHMPYSCPLLFPQEPQSTPL